MTDGTLNPTSDLVIPPERLDDLLRALQQLGYETVGPTVRDGAIVIDTLHRASELPHGWTDEQGAGTYRIRRRDDDAVFGHTVGPHSWKKYFLIPSLKLWEADRTDAGVHIQSDTSPRPRLALIGVRACEIAAIAIQDRVLKDGPYADADYAARRRDVFIVAVGCMQAASTCFCTSMATGPAPTSGYDLALTELLDADGHRFLVRSGSPAGAAVLSTLVSRPVSADDRHAARQQVERVTASMGRRLDRAGLPQMLQRTLESPHWDTLIERCLACGNCTMVCPTCFCTTVQDTSDLQGDHAERWRHWGSCFELDFSSIHGGHVRPGITSRYRQWLTHKLGTWEEQLGTLGCVGCGRCITWCPTGIDLTEEVAALRAKEAASQPGGGPCAST